MPLAITRLTCPDCGAMNITSRRCTACEGTGVLLVGEHFHYACTQCHHRFLLREDFSWGGDNDG